jgi:hypothetical protein
MTACSCTFTPLYDSIAIINQTQEQHCIFYAIQLLFSNSEHKNVYVYNIFLYDSHVSVQKQAANFLAGFAVDFLIISHVGVGKNLSRLPMYYMSLML